MPSNNLVSNETKSSKDIKFFKQLVKEVSSYRQNIYEEAKIILEKIFKAGEVEMRFSQESFLSVAIPCAGTFPSADAFIEVLRNMLPRLKRLELRLIDPNNLGLDIFTEVQEELINKFWRKYSLKIIIKKYNEDLQSYLRHKDESHILYFEHPVTSAMNVLLAQLRFEDQSTLSLRTSLPKLTNALKTNGLVIAICKSTVEIWQMKSLLNYSLDVDVHQTSTACSLLFPTDFSKGLITKKPITALNENTQNSRASNINRSDQLLVFFFSLGLLIYGAGYGKPGFLEHTASLILLWAQMFLHYPGKNGFALKCVFCLTQTAFLLKQLNYTSPSENLNPTLFRL